MLAVIDARTNLRVAEGITVRYPASPGDSWVLLGCQDEGSSAHLCWKRLSDGMQFTKDVPIHGFWIFRTVMLDAADTDGAVAEKSPPDEDPLA